MCEVTVSCNLFDIVGYVHSNIQFSLFLATRYSLFNIACYNLSSNSKLLWSYPVKPSLIIKGIINLYKQYFTTHISYTFFHNYFSMHCCILLNNTLEYIFLHTYNLVRYFLTHEQYTSIAFALLFRHIIWFVYWIPWNC